MERTNYQTILSNSLSVKSSSQSLHIFLDPSRSPNGCILYETGQQSQYDLPSHLTNDIRQLTSSISIGLFGSLYFSGLIAVNTVVVVFSIYIVEQTNGDRNGIAICFLTFGICVSWILLISGKFNRTTIEQLKSKGKLRSYLQYLQTFAECLAFYATTKQCELKTFFKLNQIVHHWNNRAAFYYFFVTFPLIIMGNSPFRQSLSSSFLLFRCYRKFNHVYFTSIFILFLTSK